MAITDAKYTSRDGWRLTYVEDGELKHLRGDHPSFAAFIASNTVGPFEEPVRAGMQFQAMITSKFWDKVAGHFGVPVDRARTHIGIMGSPPAVQALWQKATALMDSPGITRDDVDDEINW